MPDLAEEYRFHIHGFTPDTIPMKRLAEYMETLADLLGHPNSVHFVRIESGSLSVVHRIDPVDIPKVQGRLTALARDPENAPSDVVSAYDLINNRLRSDNTTGEILAGDNVIQFPGRETVEQPTPPIIGPVVQRETLVGIPIMIGGKRDLVAVQIETADGSISCHAKRSIARRLGQYLFEDVIKAVGEAHWIRTNEDGWIRRDFIIDDFERTEDHTLEESLEAIRRATRGHWETDDPINELLRLRREG